MPFSWWRDHQWRRVLGHMNESSPLEILILRQITSFCRNLLKISQLPFLRGTLHIRSLHALRLKKVVHVSRLQKCCEIDHPIVRCTVTPSTNLPKKFIFPTFWKILSDVRLALADASGCWSCWWIQQGKNHSSVYGFVGQKTQVTSDVWNPKHTHIGEKKQLRWYSQQKFIPCLADPCCTPSKAPLEENLVPGPSYLVPETCSNPAQTSKAYRC